MFKVKPPFFQRRKIKFLIFAFTIVILLSLIFYSLNFFTASAEFFANNMTSGSDDASYYSESVFAVQRHSILHIDRFLIDVYDYSGHAIGYPLFLFFVFSFYPSLHFGVFLNILFYSFAVILCVFSNKFSREENFYSRVALFIVLTPGILLTSLHLFKDALLFLLTIYSIFCMQNGFLKRGIFFALLTHIFRPYNFLIILLPYVVIKYPRVSLFFVVSIISSYVAGLGFATETVDSIVQAITFSQTIAVRDLESISSSFTPSESLFVNFVLGLIRFLLLPLPWIYSPGNVEPVFYFMIYIQSLIIWSGLIAAFFYKNFFIDFLMRNRLLFAYTLLHASTYSVLYFGNANFRYRVFLFAIVAMFLTELLFSSRPRTLAFKRR
jgi:hypothetical protein